MPLNLQTGGLNYGSRKRSVSKTFSESSIYESVSYTHLDKPYSCFDGSCNPENPTHWLKEFLDNEELDIYLQRYTIFDNPFLPEEFVQQLCKEYEGTIYYDRLILGLWKRADGAIYKRFADNPEAFRCEVVDRLSPDPVCKQFQKEDITSIEIGLDFGGNQSGHSFVARAVSYTHLDVYKRQGQSPGRV